MGAAPATGSEGTGAGSPGGVRGEVGLLELLSPERFPISLPPISDTICIPKSDSQMVSLIQPLNESYSHQQYHYTPYSSYQYTPISIIKCSILRVAAVRCRAQIRGSDRPRKSPRWICEISLSTFSHTHHIWTPCQKAFQFDQSVRNTVRFHSPLMRSVRLVQV